MSRAFVKESDSDTPPQLPELPVSPGPNPVTARGLAQLQARLANNQAQQAQLADNRSPEFSAPDLLLQRAELQREQRWLEARLGSALLRPSSTQPSRVQFGSLVTLVDEHGTPYRYRIVGEDEAAPEQGRISWHSPLASALMQASIGEEVIWQRPAGPLRVEILAVDAEPDSNP